MASKFLLKNFTAVYKMFQFFTGRNFVKEAHGNRILEFFKDSSRNSKQNSAHIDKHRPCICISYIVCPPYLIKVDMCFDEP